MSASCWRCQLPTRAAITRLRWALLPQRFGRATEQTADVTTAACRSLQRAQRSVCSTVPLQDSRGGNVRATAGGVRALSRRHSMLQNTVRAASTTQSDSTPSTGRPHAGLRLFVYSKDGCHLCDTLKEKLEAVLSRAQYQQSPLSGASLEVRDITTRQDWFQKYQYEIPVLTYHDAETRELEVPRASPRVTADRLEKHIISSIGAS